MNEQEKKIAELEIEVAQMRLLLGKVLETFEKHVKFNFQSHNEMFEALKENFTWIYKWAKEVSGVIDKEKVDKLFVDAEKSQKYLM